MFLRMLVLVASVQPSLARPLGAPLIATGVALILVAVWQWRRRSSRSVPAEEVEPVAPFDLGTALGFGGFLAVLAVLVPAAKQWLGAPGIYGLAALSGLADVDATVISVSQLHGTGGLPLATTVVAVGLTTIANMGTKATIAWTTGGTAVGWPVLRGYVVAMAVGAVAVAWAVLT